MPELESVAYDPSSLPAYLPIYYKYIFPYGPYYQWLSYGGVDKNYIANREFSFTFENDVYIRYQTFFNQQEMEKKIQQTMPYKIDIGAVFNHPAAHHNKYSKDAFKPLEKELVFDIDMTDYDDVRKCCQGADICKNCWPLMSIAIKVIDQALKDDFGFKHCLWIYSGRRGVHCWVCDEKARKLTMHGRTSIVEYLSVIHAGQHDKKVHIKDPVHPFLRRCLSIISKQYWDNYALELQEIFKNPEDVRKILNMVPDPEAREDISEQLLDGKLITSEQRWEKFKAMCSKYYKQDSKRYRKMRYVVQEVQMEFCYPRLDVNVSKGINHLLKSPFCVHPKTGKVCVPIDVSNADEFDPFSVPTISQLCNELESYKGKDDPSNKEIDSSDTTASRKVHLYKKISMKEPVAVFEKFLNGLMVDVKQRQGSDDQNVDF